MRNIQPQTGFDGCILKERRDVVPGPAKEREVHLRAPAHLACEVDRGSDPRRHAPAEIDVGTSERDKAGEVRGQLLLRAALARSRCGLGGYTGTGR
jgi:hypothetical protein